jgi:trans-aconitate methyltransferase
MSPSDALALLAPAFRSNSSITYKSRANPTRWADLGCGAGTFTLALASLLQSQSTIYAVDRKPAIRTQIISNHVSIESLKADFAKDPLPRDLDGILMANSLHFVKDKPALIQNLRRTTLRPQHAFLVVEYDTDRATPIWVPYPVSFTSLQSIFQAAGYSRVTRLADHPSIYNRNVIYSALITE